MKKCRWNIQRPVWAFLVILCCHGNFADDPLPSFNRLPDDFTQRQTRKTVPIGGLTDSTARTDDFVTLASIESVAAAAPLQGDASIFDEKTPVLTNSLNQPSAGVQIGDEDNTSALPADANRKDGDQLASSSETTDRNPEKLAAPERSNPLLVEGVLSQPLPAGHAPHAHRQKDKQDNAGTIPQDEVPLPEKPAESERTKLPGVGEEGQSAKTVGQQQPDVEVTSEQDKQPLTAELKNEADNATPVKQQPPTQAPPLHPMDDSGTPASEDMPSFSEWSKKRLEEQVKQGSSPPAAASQQNKASSKQVRHKNYASVDCGAKVINANPEAQSTGAVLSHFRDDYMLNPCTAKIWLVIELCESIQADRIDLANFELFSSSPREFSVYSSDRYPTREWTSLGTFEATDERTVQNFSFEHTSFGKYIKVELVSRYGSEHFCPLSLVRVFGTSEYEALETEESADSHGRGVADEDDEEASHGDHLSSHESQNLFGSAKDVVMNIVKKVLRGDKSDSASPGASKVEQASPSPESHFCSDSNNCICLQRLPDADCEGGNEENKVVAEAACRKDAALAHLRCHYPELLTFLLHGWPGTFHGRLLEQCFSTCVPYIEECGRDIADFSRLGRASAPIHPTCRFYGAIMSPVSFGALCHLDKLLLDEHIRLPVAVPQCRGANLTSNLSAVSLDILHVPTVTPTALFETASSLVGFAKSAASSGDSYQCDSLDHITVCSTRLDSPVLGAPLSPASESRGTGSIPVIHTGAIETEEHPGEGGQSTSSSSSFQSQILPTRTLPGDAKAPLKSKAVQNDKAPCISASELGASVPKSDGMPGPASKESSIELPQAASPDPAATSAPSKAKVSSSSKETNSLPVAVKSSDVPSSGSEVKPDGSKVPKEQLTSVVIKQPVDSTVAVQPPQDANVAREVPGSAPPQGAELDSDAAILEQEQAAFEEGTSTAVPSPGLQNGDGVPGGGNGKPQNNGGLNGAGIVAPGQKESVFVRLSNRIKALELNMSLSGQYLEELSRRYRKQMEEMQKAFNKTIGALNETARSAYERDVRQQEVILNLQSQLDSMYKMVLNLQEEQDGIHATVVTRHILLMAVEACVMGALFMACVRSGQKQKVRNGRAVSVVHPNTSAASKRSFDDEGRRKRSSSPDTLHRRRNSDSNAVGRQCASASTGLDMRDRRRPSTEALNVSGSYSDLMIEEPTIPVWTAGPPLKEQEHSRKKKKHKNKQQGKQELKRSVSNNVLLCNSNSQKPPPAPPKNSLSRKNSGTGLSSAGLLFAAMDKSGTTSRVQELTRKDKFSDYGGKGGAQYNFSNLFNGYYGGCPPPEFPPKLALAKLPLHLHQQQNGGLKKAAVGKVCG